MIKIKRFFIASTLFLTLITSVNPAHATNSESPQHNIPELAQKNGAGSDYFKLKNTEEKLKENNLLEAEKLLAKVSEPVFAFWKNVLQAEVYLAQDKPREVVALLKNFPPAPDYELTYGEGTYENIYKRGLFVRIAAKKKISDKPEWEVGQLLALFGGDDKVSSALDASDLATSLTKEQKILKLHSLHARYQFKDVPGLITTNEVKSTKLPKDKICQALYELGNSLRYNSGQGADSSTAFLALYNNDCGDDYTARALYWLGSLAGSVGAANQEYLTKLYKNFPSHRLADDAVYKMYQIAKKQNDSKDQSKYFDLLMSLKKGDMKGTLAFELAYPLFEAGKFKQAAEIFSKAIDTEPTADESLPRALYWYGRSLEKSQGKQNSAKAKAAYQKLATLCPQSFYAILAAKRLGVALKAPTLPQLSGSSPGNGNNYFSLVDHFNQNGFHHAARTVLDLGLHVHPEWQENNKEYLAKKLIESQSYRKALAIAAKHFDSGVYGPVSDVNDNMVAAFFPWAFRDKTSIGYSLSSLPKGAIEGIMREESLFQTTARSRVGATGLMQLMPATAAMLRRDNASNAFATDLTDPESSIVLGATYLSDMKNYFNGQLPLAIMAYNAGPGNVNKWLRNFGNLELDEFIENVPLEETRGYVKRVMRSMQVYGALYKEPYFLKNQELSFNIKGGSSAKN